MKECLEETNPKKFVSGIDFDQSFHDGHILCIQISYKANMEKI